MKIEYTSSENRYLTAADFSDTGKKIKSFERLEHGWHFGEGRPPARDLIEKAIELENLALDLGFTRTDAFPGPNGEVRHCVYSEDCYYEFTLELDGSVTTMTEKAGVENEEVSAFEEARNVLKKVSVWNISDLFIGDSGTSKRKISKEWLFRIPQRTELFQWLKPSVAQNEMNAASALGLMSFTPNTHHVLQSGSSMTNYYRKEQGSQTSQAIPETNVIETCAA